ncbi:hypothetical protein [Limnobacter sp.]|uniref:hypothetical protein n=1 Tax=Limnobacter sp. TaxID=2003368 RepID=UPI00311FB96F
MQGINSLYYSPTIRPMMARGGIASIRQPYGFGSFVKKAVGAITKPVAKILDKVIPNEIKPALPYLAAIAPFIIPPQFAFASQGIFSNPALSRALLAGGLSLGSQMAQEGYDPNNPNLIAPLLTAGSAYLATPGTGDALRGSQIAGTSLKTGQPITEAALAGTSDLYGMTDPTLLQQVQNLGIKGAAASSDFLSQGTTGFENILKGSGNLSDLASFGKAAAVPIGTQVTTDAVSAAKEALEKYEADLAAFNAQAAEKTTATNLTRARAIYDSMTNTGLFGTDAIKGALEQLGLPTDFFAYGGRVKKAEGGLMNLRMGGMPAEIDARQAGGFIPIGRAERADDVPARLSQNEFVMTADAVRGMGQGNINLGAQRMYDIMKQYEPIGRALV